MSETAASAAPTMPAAPPVAPAAAPVTPAAPAAAPKAPEAAPQLDAIARTQAQFAQREIALTKERQRLAAERDSHKAELETAKQRAARLDRIEQLKATDPLAALKELGLDYSTLTKEQLKSNPDGPLKRADFDAWKKEQDERLAAKETAAQKAAEEARQAQDRAAYQQAYEKHRNEARSLVEGNRDKYEVLLDSFADLTGAADVGDVLLDVIEHDYKTRIAAGEKDVRPMSVAEAADKANAAAEERAERVAAAVAKKKARTPAAPAAPPVPADAKGGAEAKVKPPVDKQNAAVDDAPADKPVFDPSAEDFADFIRRYRRWENAKKAS